MWREAFFMMSSTQENFGPVGIFKIFLVDRARTAGPVGLEDDGERSSQATSSW